MKSFIQKVLILVGLVSVVPFFGYAASLSCSSDYSTYLTGKSDANFTAYLSDGVGTYVYEWSGDVSGDSLKLSDINFATPGLKRINFTASSTEEKLEASCDIEVYDLSSRKPTVSASCSYDADIAPVGQGVVWLSDINGPFGPYTVTWQGDGPLSGTGESISITATGQEMNAKMMSVVSTRYIDDSAFDAFDINTEIPCDGPVYIIPAKYSNTEKFGVTGSCLVSVTNAYVNDSVTWDASGLVVTGYIDPVVYNWTDTSDNSSMGTGTTTSKAYSSTGDKGANILVVSGSRSEVVSCLNSVNVRNRSTGGRRSSSSNDEETASSTATSTNSTATSTSTSTPSTATSTPGSNSNSTSTPEITGGEMGGDITDGYEAIDDYSFSKDQNPGAYNEVIASLQKRLTDEGFYNGLVGGYFGPVTLQALKDYQTAKGLPVTGVLDLATRNSLNGIVVEANPANNNSSLFAAAVALASENWPVALYALLIATALGLISWLFFIIKKSDQNR